ncbi:MAG: GMP synthase subunit A [Candidatus Altiarchaeota archaeon]|nr:GMP synthase subunit A [Candidatus Altiarchaeota archaeon]
MERGIVIINNGGQYVHRIWRSLRELEVGSEIVPNTASVDEVMSKNPKGIILSGGPWSVYKDNLGNIEDFIRIDLPILGICLGHQVIAQYFGGKVESGLRGEYGFGEIMVDEEDEILKGMPKKFQAWISHRDEVTILPKGFRALAHSGICNYEAMRHEKKPIFGVQFHPEVFHTQNGKLILKNFVDTAKNGQGR